MEQITAGVPGTIVFNGRYANVKRQLRTLSVLVGSSADFKLSEEDRQFIRCARDWPGPRVRRLRNALNLTQEDFADGIGVTFSTINKWENGRSVPNRIARRVMLEAAKRAQAPPQIKEMLM